MQRDYFRIIPAVFLILARDGKILLLRRRNTGYEDGNYSLPAGHVEEGENCATALAREVKEEIGLEVKEDDFEIAHVMYRLSGDQTRVDFFFTASRAAGDPRNMEPDKCDDLRWFPLDELPQNTIPCIRRAIENYRRNIFFSEFGWESK